MFNWTEYFCITSNFISNSLTPTHHTSREWLDNRALEAYFQIYLSHTLSVWSAFMLHCWLRADKYLERIFFFYWQTCSVNCTSLVLCLEESWLGDVTKRAGGNCLRRWKCSVQCVHSHHRDCCFGWFTQNELTILDLLSILFSLALCLVFYTNTTLWLCKWIWNCQHLKPGADGVMLENGNE